MINIIERSNHMNGGLKPCSVSSIMKKMKQQDPFMRANYFGKLAPHLAALGEERKLHVLHVVDNFRALFSGEEDQLYSMLSPEKRSETTEIEYKRKLELIKDVFIGLSGEEKKEVYLALILHDMGYTKSDSSDHAAAGKEIVARILRESRIPVDADKVALLASDHGLFPDFGVNVFPDKLHSIDKYVLRQIFVIDCLDSTSKISAKSSSVLGTRVIDDMLSVLDRAEKRSADNKDWFFTYRLKHLFAPCTYYRMRDENYNYVMRAISRHLDARQQKKLIDLVTGRLINDNFFAFDRINMKSRYSQEVVMFLYEIAERASEMSLAQNEKVVFRVIPDIFSKSYDAKTYEETMKFFIKSLSPYKLTFDRNKFLITYEQNGQKIITLKLSKLQMLL